jgi:hypothetical protein
MADIRRKLGRSLGTDFYLIDDLLNEDVRTNTVFATKCAPFVAMSTVAAGLVLQESSRADASLCVIFGATSSLVMTSIAMLGSEEQKQRWFRRWRNWKNRVLLP